MHLTVIHPFTLQEMGEDKVVTDRAFVRGDQITDEDEIKSVLEGPNARNVVRCVSPINGQKLN